MSLLDIAGVLGVGPVDHPGIPRRELNVVFGGDAGLQLPAAFHLGVTPPAAPRTRPTWRRAMLPGFTLSPNAFTSSLSSLRLWLGRWRESLVTVVAIVGELLIFLVITATVHRERPAVPQLDQAPPTSSFPSGHTGAAVALYGCLAVILLRHISRRWVAVGPTIVGFAVPVLVAVSRVYRGMHYLTDVVAGAIAGGIWLTAVLVVLLRTASPSHVATSSR